MSCKSTGKPGRLMLALMCVWVACAAGFLLIVEYISGWFLFFSPGWANGFPFGLSFQTVLSVGMTGYILLLLMTAATGIGATGALICTLLGFGWERVGRDYRIWFWFVVGLLLLSGVVYWYCYVWVWEQFPDGYYEID
jgi:hypothetical protein